MLEEIYAALESYGYNEFDGSDEMIINLIIDSAEQHIKGFSYFLMPSRSQKKGRFVSSS